MEWQSAHVLNVSDLEIAEAVSHCHRVFDLRACYDDAFGPIVAGVGFVKHLVGTSHFKSLYVFISADGSLQSVEFNIYGVSLDGHALVYW